MFSHLKALSALTILGVACLARGQEPATAVDRPTADEVRERLAVCVNNALTVNAFDDMISSLSKYNRDRIAETPFDGHDRLNGAIAKVRRSYRAAYGGDLKITTEALRDVRVERDFDRDHVAASAKDAADGTPNVRLAREAFAGNPWRVSLANPSAELVANALERHLGNLAAAHWPKDRCRGSTDHRRRRHDGADRGPSQRAGDPGLRQVTRRVSRPVGAGTIAA